MLQSTLNCPLLSYLFITTASPVSCIVHWSHFGFCFPLQLLGFNLWTTKVKPVLNSHIWGKQIGNVVYIPDESACWYLEPEINLWYMVQLQSKSMFVCKRKMLTSRFDGSQSWLITLACWLITCWKTYRSVQLLESSCMIWWIVQQRKMTEPCFNFVSTLPMTNKSLWSIKIYLQWNKLFHIYWLFQSPPTC